MIDIAGEFTSRIVLTHGVRSQVSVVTARIRALGQFASNINRGALPI